MDELSILVQWNLTDAVTCGTGPLLPVGDLNGEVTILQAEGLTSYSLHCGIQFRTEQG